MVVGALKMVVGALNFVVGELKMVVGALNFVVGELKMVVGGLNFVVCYLYLSCDAQISPFFPKLGTF